MLLLTSANKSVKRRPHNCRILYSGPTARDQPAVPVLPQDPTENSRHMQRSLNPLDSGDARCLMVGC